MSFITIPSNDIPQAVLALKGFCWTLQWVVECSGALLLVGFHRFLVLVTAFGDTYPSIYLVKQGVLTSNIDIPMKMKRLPASLQPRSDEVATKL